MAAIVLSTPRHHDLFPLPSGTDGLSGLSEDGRKVHDAAVPEAIREFVGQRDRFAEIYRDKLRLAEEMSKQDVERVTEDVLRLCRSAIAQRNTLNSRVKRLATAGQFVEGGGELERAGADFEQWLEDVPDELLLHYRPVTDAVEQAALESLRNPPTASDWRSLFDEEANSGWWNEKGNDCFTCTGFRSEFAEAKDMPFENEIARWDASAKSSPGSFAALLREHWRKECLMQTKEWVGYVVNPSVMLSAVECKPLDASAIFKMLKSNKELRRKVLAMLAEGD